MRIPTNKIYRAFPQLDRFSDEQCNLLMRRVKVQGGGYVMIHTLAVSIFLVVLLIMTVLVFRMPLPDWLAHLAKNLDILIRLIIIFTVPAIVSMAVRDRVFRRHLINAIEIQVERVRRPQCQYILIGLTPVNDTVTCPECGRTTDLRSLGVTPQDLAPPESDFQYIEHEQGSR